jgi:hypothetical protein
VAKYSTQWYRKQSPFIPWEFQCRRWNDDLSKGLKTFCLAHKLGGATNRIYKWAHLKGVEHFLKLHVSSWFRCLFMGFLLFLDSFWGVQWFKTEFHYVAKAGLELHPPASTSWMLGIQVCATISSCFIRFLKRSLTP